MVFGILEPKTDQKVPGTVHVQSETEEQKAITSNLKHGGKGEEATVLVPQPSDSINDPLSKSQSNSLSWRTRANLLKRLAASKKALPQLVPIGWDWSGVRDSSFPQPIKLRDGQADRHHYHRSFENSCCFDDCHGRGQCSQYTLGPHVWKAPRYGRV